MKSLMVLWMAALLAVVLQGCGARTGLLVPPIDAGPDVTAIDTGPDVFDVPVIDTAPPGCATGTFVLVARAADLILVIDRSGSMSDRLASEVPGDPSKWELLRSAVSSTLPMFQREIDVGALFFPESNSDGQGASCALADIPNVDVDPNVGTAPAIQAIFDNTSPSGATPTAAALLRAYTYFVRNPNRARARYLVLATDGGPNCNAALNPATCVCTSQGKGYCGGRNSSDGSECLDSVRTAQELSQIATSPVTSMPTFVIGLSDETDPNFNTTLTAMAIAGGRPNILPDGTQSFYDVRQPGDLTTAFTTIQNTIARCTFVTPSAPTDTGSVTISLGGVTLPQDPTHINGWDWTNRPFGELTLFGAACPSSDSPTTTVTATVVCDASDP